MSEILYDFGTGRSDPSTFPTQALQDAAEEILAELRQSSPAAGFDRVEIPGERVAGVDEPEIRLRRYLTDLGETGVDQLRRALAAGVAQEKALHGSFRRFANQTASISPISGADFVAVIEPGLACVS